MFGFVKGTSGVMDKLAILSVRGATGPFGDIRANTIGRPYQLFANRIASEVWPSLSYRPDPISNIFRQSINFQVFKTRS
jgi:hypothetical protein